ncbi:hypothetical protein DPEC_G00168490 [Dallia pectoralis]|uniref:Uncharacterized protein n=1 Tax=Dallia pectoralis TaxID=75939 RepID=A0ACC2GCN6_DALPE|nr:hypothetical protein DPEC_G00168490 [Dallia pectoralis]
MNSMNYSPTTKEEVCWTEKQGLWLNIVIKEEEKEVSVTDEGLKVKEEGDGIETEEKDPVLAVKEEGEDTVLRVKKEEEISVSLKEQTEEERVVLFKTGESCDNPTSSAEPEQHKDTHNSTAAVSCLLSDLLLETLWKTCL